MFESGIFDKEIFNKLMIIKQKFPKMISYTGNTRESEYEYIEYPDIRLNTIIDTLDTNEKKHIIRQILQFMVFSHSQMLIHGDFQDHNIIHTNTNDIVIIDWENSEIIDIYDESYVPIANQMIDIYDILKTCNAILPSMFIQKAMKLFEPIKNIEDKILDNNNIDIHDFILHHIERIVHVVNNKTILHIYENTEKNGLGLSMICYNIFYYISYSILHS